MSNYSKDIIFKKKIAVQTISYRNENPLLCTEPFE